MRIADGSSSPPMTSKRDASRSHVLKRPARPKSLELARAPRTRPASELADIVHALSGFTAEELAHVPVVEPGSRLTSCATYLDLGALRGGSFSAPIEAYAGTEARYVAQADVAPALWERLLSSSKSRR